jgi:hypothetical protein
MSHSARAKQTVQGILKKAKSRDIDLYANQQELEAEQKIDELKEELDPDFDPDASEQEEEPVDSEDDYDYEDGFVVRDGEEEEQPLSQEQSEEEEEEAESEEETEEEVVQPRPKESYNFRTSKPQLVPYKTERIIYYYTPDKQKRVILNKKLEKAPLVQEENSKPEIKEENDQQSN